MKKNQCKLEPGEKYYQFIFEKGLTIDKYYKGKNFNISTDVEKMLNLVEGLIRMSKFKVIHRDIKPDNIVHLKNNFFFIDYGLVTSFKRIFQKSEYFALEASYFVYPPEFKLFINKTLKDYMHEFPNSMIKLLENCKVASLKDLILELKMLIMNYKNKVFKRKEVNKSKIDVFSFGISFLVIISDHLKVKVMTTIHSDLVLILRRCILFDPNQRCSPEELKCMLLKYITFYIKNNNKPVSIIDEKSIYNGYFER
jgi:serine/threonine protein kinase